MKNLKEIILVEDNTDDAELVLGIFKRYGLLEKTLHLLNGEEVLDIFFKHEKSNEVGPCLKLIILDIKMPKVDGFTVLEKLKVKEETKNIPIVMLTSSAVEDDIKKAYERGANSYIVKPIDYEDFEITIERMVDFWIGVNKINIF